MTDKTNKIHADLPKESVLSMIMHTVMHAATQNDIARLDNRIEKDIARLDHRIEKLEEKLDTKASKNDLKELRKDMNKQFKMLIGFIFTGMLAMTGILLKFLH